MQENVLGTGSPCSEPPKDSWTSSAKPFQATRAPPAVGALSCLSCLALGSFPHEESTAGSGHRAGTSGANRNSEKVTGKSYFNLSPNVE